MYASCHVWLAVKHHYVPQFFLKRWADADGKVHVFQVRHGTILGRARRPEYTGFEYDLYGLVSNAFGLGKDHLEERLFGPIDSNAAVVLDKLERHQAISEHERVAWTFFLSSLRIRQPDVLVFLRKEGMDRLKADLAKRDAATLASDAMSTEQWFNRTYPGAIEAMTLINWLPRMILHDDVTAAFGEMRWWIREFDADQPALLLSDLPIHWEGGFKSELFMIQLPVGSRRVFFGARSKHTEEVLDGIPQQQLIERINRTTLASSAGRVWASDEIGGRAVIAANLEIYGANGVDFASLAPPAESSAPAGGS
jgi:hypothetical protein